LESFLKLVANGNAFELFYWGLVLRLRQAQKIKIGLSIGCYAHIKDSCNFFVDWEGKWHELGG